MNQSEKNTQRLLGRILSQPVSDVELAAVDAFGGTQIKTGETVGLDSYINGRYDAPVHQAPAQGPAGFAG